MCWNIILRYRHMQFILLCRLHQTKNHTQSSSSATSTTTPTSGPPSLRPPSPLSSFVYLTSRNGRWRSIYKYNPQTSTLNGTVTITVHYFEDGNVLLKTDHPVSKEGITSPSALINAIAEDEKMYQEELNRTFAGLGDGIFKGLRRLLPVTKQKIEWERIASYKVKPGQK